HLHPHPHPHPALNCPTENINSDDNESRILWIEQNESSNEEDENFNINQQLFIDTIALDAAIANANVITNREIISNNNNEQYSSTLET
ncbi:unnamed protein product, partial [Rotaria sp. Silwood2]